MADPSAVGMVHVVDDEPSFRRSLISSLAPSGWQCREYENGAAFLREWHPDQRGIVTLDIFMGPEGDGWSIARRLLDLRCHMPIIFLTGFPPETARKNFTIFSERKDIEFLMKSTAPSELREVVRDLSAREPALYRADENERDLLQTTVTKLTKTERKVLSLAMQGKDGAAIVDILEMQARTAVDRVNEIRRSALAKLSWADNMIAAASAFAPLYSKFRVSNLVELAVMEVCWRLCQLNSAQVSYLMQSIAGNKDLRVALQEGVEDEVLRVLRIESIENLSELAIEEVCWRLRELNVAQISYLMKSIDDNKALRVALQAGVEDEALRVLRVESIGFVKNYWFKWLAEDELKRALDRLGGDAMMPVRDWLQKLSARG